MVLGAQGTALREGLGVNHAKAQVQGRPGSSDGPGRNATGAVQTGALTRVSGRSGLPLPTVQTASSALRGLRDGTGRGAGGLEEATEGLLLGYRWVDGGPGPELGSNVQGGQLGGKRPTHPLPVLGVPFTEHPHPETLRPATCPEAQGPRGGSAQFTRARTPPESHLGPQNPRSNPVPRDGGSDEVKPLGGAGGGRPPAHPPTPLGAPSMGPGLLRNLSSVTELELSKQE